MGRKDMGTLYAEHMDFFGLGTALFHPNSASDMKPPCVGYLDSSRRWNHIANIPFPGSTGSVYTPLEKTPKKMADLKIEWRPKTTLGVNAVTVAAQAETPDGLPAGADASVRYSSKTNFGAILIAQKPVTLTSYNDETLFRHWINQNYSRLAQLHGVELSRYGLWLVTRTYTTPKASINAWQSRDKDAVISVKAKADMMGDLGAQVDWQERSTDKDWAHHAAPEGVVAFFDGINVAGWQWWRAGVNARIRKNLGISKFRLRPARQRLGPNGSWKPAHRGDPAKPQAAPGADDAWVLSPVLKDRQRFIPDMTAEEKDEYIAKDLPTRAATDPLAGGLHLAPLKTSLENGAPPDSASTDGKPVSTKDFDQIALEKKENATA